MKLLTRQQQDTLLDFIVEQYLVALRSHKNGIMNVNQFRHHVVNCPGCSGKTILFDMFGGLKLTCSED